MGPVLQSDPELVYPMAWLLYLSLTHDPETNFKAQPKPD